MKCLLSNTAHDLPANKPASKSLVSLILVCFETSIAATYVTIAVPYINKYRYSGAYFIDVALVSEVINHYFFDISLGKG